MATSSRQGRFVRTALPAFFIALSGAMAPGPLLALVIAQVLAQGGLAVFWVLAGHAAIEAVFVTALARGFGRLLQRARVRMWLSLVGGAVLVWMGWMLAVQAGEVAVTAQAAPALSAAALFLGGAGVSLSNPYFTGWWATVGAGQVAALRLKEPRDYIAFLTGHELGDTAWYATVAVLLTFGRQWLSVGVYRTLLLLCAGTMVVMGAAFGIVAFRARTGRRSPAP
ncbi:MAG: LysE family transporter [Kiritimatiellaeota bacterium]|nr:LysE family transporter [Kiritimatiellota bacterium]